jgi:uncharacterized protein (DUF427 family)
MTTTTETSQARASVRTEPGAKRIRAYLGGELVADTTRPVLVWEVPYYPTYYLPVEDVRSDVLQPDGGLDHSPSRGDGRTFTPPQRSGRPPTDKEMAPPKRGHS